MTGRDDGAATASQERCIVSSFDHVLLAAFGAMAPRVPRGLLLAAGRSWRLRALAGVRLLRPRAVHPQAILVTPARTLSWRRAGLAVNAWTADDPAEIERLVRAGVTAVITNRPAIAREVLRRAAGR